MEHHSRVIAAGAVTNTGLAANSTSNVDSNVVAESIIKNYVSQHLRREEPQLYMQIVYYLVRAFCGASFS